MQSILGLGSFLASTQNPSVAAGFLQLGSEVEQFRHHHTSRRVLLKTRYLTGIISMAFLRFCALWFENICTPTKSRMALERVLSAFPPVAFGMAYGSGVFTQAGYSAADNPMIDFVFAVDDARAWHAENLRRNPEHYASALRGRPSLVASLQEMGGAYMYYNTLPRIAIGFQYRVQVPLPAAVGGAPGQAMKYGIISLRDLVDDLLHWRTLYISGRMHKPVRILKKGSEQLKSATRENLRHALRAALLQLPTSFSARQLYTTIAGLSYTGDFRMVFGENPNKVSNIVSKNLSHFHALYSPIIQASFPHVEERNGGSNRADQDNSARIPTDSEVERVRFSQDTSPEARLALAMSLPITLQKRMASSLFAERTGRSFYQLAMSRWRGNKDDGTDEIDSIPGQAALPATPAAAPDAPATGPRSWWTKRADAYAMLRYRPFRPLAQAVQLAERGRAMMVRMRQQRLQWVVGRRLRSQQNASRTTVDKAADSALTTELINLHDSESSVAQASFVRATQDPEVIAFWDEMLRRASKPEFINRSVAMAWQPREIEGIGMVAGDVAFPAQRYLRPAIANVVGPAARTQSIKGIITAGPTKAALYAWAKVEKYLKVVLRR